MTTAQTGDQHIYDPFTIQFSTVFCDAYGLWENTEKLFSKAWDDFWAIAPHTVYTPNQERIAFCRESFDKFQRDNGFVFLKELYNKKADPNFILALLIQYLWDKDVPENENDAPDLKGWKDRLNAFRLVRHTYETEKGADDQLVQQLRAKEETIDRLFIRPKDTRANKKHPPSDKENRVIFAVYQHVRQRTDTPQWQLLFDLLKSANAVRASSYDSPHTHLKPRIKSFEKDHPKEATFLKYNVLKETRPFWKARWETLPPLKPYADLT